MTTNLESFASFVPRIIVERLATDAQPPSEAVSEEFPAAVFFADVAGFTELTERIGREGPDGVERLTDLLNDYFGRIIEIVDAHGGDVIKFAGDAIIAIWRAEPSSDGLHRATLRAASCGMDIQQKLHEFSISSIRLSQRISISCGEVRSLEIGGVLGRWEWLIGGKPVEQMAEVNEHAQTGRVALSEDARSLISGEITCDDVPRGTTLLHGIDDPVKPFRADSPRLTPAMETGLRAFIPVAILDRMTAGHSEWLGELRQVTILFVNLPTLDRSTRLELVQSAMLTLQASTYNWEGSINKLSVDDKGTTLVAVLGLPPLPHEDDPVRGIETAFQIKSGLAEIGLESSIGIATGRVFCGPVGNTIRREYTVMGDQVNLAARLMQAADGGILCDSATYQRSSDRFEFSALPPMQFKGKSAPLDVYRPEQGADNSQLQPLRMIGRFNEIAIFKQALTNLHEDSKNTVIIVRGAADIGKTRLLEEMGRLASDTGIVVCLGVADPLQKGSVFYPWRSVLRQVMEIEGLSHDAASRRDAILNHLKFDPELVDRAALLNPVLTEDFPEGDNVSQMEGKTRAANTQELLIKILKRATQNQPMLLLLDDAQWFDSSSWALTALVARRIPELVLVIAMRPTSDRLPDELKQLLERPETRELNLGPLDPAEIVQILCDDLSVEKLPDELETLINERVEGHPCFARQLVYALRDTHLIRCRDGLCELTCEPSELGQLDFTDALSRVITHRLDGLVPHQQMAAKTASVIGRSFSFQLLQAIYPFAESKGQLNQCMDALEQDQILTKLDSNSSGSYRFVYGMIQQVAYQLMLFGQRRTLHQSIAEHFETYSGSSRDAALPLLAHHWKRAGNTARSLNYTRDAANNALRVGNYAEAVQFLTDLVAEMDDSVEPADRLDRAVIERMLAQAYLGTGDLSASRDHSYSALNLLGRKTPTKRFSLIVAIGLQTVRQILHRIRPGKLRLRNDDAAAMQAAVCFQQLAEVHYFENETLKFLFAVLSSLNTSEMLAIPAEQARAYANLGVTLGASPLRSAAESYLKKARTLAASAGHLPTQVWVHLVDAVFCNGIGDWNRSRSSIEKSLGFARLLGDERQIGVLLTLRGATYFHEANFTRAKAHWSEVLAMGQHRNDPLQEAWGYGGLAMNHLRLSDHGSAIDCGESALRLFQTNADRISEIATEGVLAVAYLREDQRPRALELADTLLRKLKQLGSPTSYYLFEAYSAVSEVFLHELELCHHERNSQAAVLRRTARSAVGLMLQYARVFPIGQPRSLLRRGQLQSIKGNPRKACRMWYQCIAVSEQLKMKHDLGTAHYHLGVCRYLPKTTRRMHLNAALSLFTASRAESERRTAEAELTRI